MRLILGILLALVFLAVFHHVQSSKDDALPPKKVITACNANKDCTFVETPCGTPQPVNLVYHEALEKKYFEGRENIDCLWHDARKAGASFCLDGYCRVQTIKEKAEDSGR